jgi:hypothetical protein
VRTASAVALLCLVFSGLMLAQVPQQQVAAPTPQQQMMGYFAGDWTITGTAKISPNSPSAPLTGTEHAEWLPGGSFVEIHSVMKGPMGDIHSTRMLEYNALDKVFTYNAYNSLGQHTMAVGTVEGKTWVWNTEEKLNGVITKGRYTVTFISADAYSFKSEVPKPSGGWVTVMEGKAVRTAGQ